MSNIKYSKDFLEEVVNKSKSIKDVLIHLNLKTTGGSHYFISNKIKQFGINIGHFVKNYHMQVPTNKHSKESFLISLVENSNLNGTRTLKRLLEFEIKEQICEICKNKKWNNLVIPLEIDHINGNHFDNRIENLRIICPNCHAQTDTYRSKNRI